MKTLFAFILTLTAAFAFAQPTSDSLQRDLPTEPLDVVTAFLTAYLEHDHARFASFIHPDIVWVQPGDNRISGVKNSKQQLLLMGRTMHELSAGSIQLTDVRYFSATGNTVTCILHWQAVQPTGNKLDIDNIDVYTIEDGKIIMARIFSEDIEQENKFWSK